jgi:hypothetical protein
LLFKASPVKASNKLAVKAPVNPEAPKVLTKAEIEKAKHDFLSGRKSLPPEANLTEDEVVEEYVYSCSQISLPEQRVRCFDFYFEHHDDSYNEKKSQCGSDTACLDNVYYEMASTTQDTYCHAIADDSKREECIRTII